MRIRVISNKDEIDALSPQERMVHLTFRASNVDILKLIRICPRLRVIQLPTSYMRTISKATRTLLQMEGIDLLEGDVWGHRKDLDEYFIVEKETVDQIRSLAKGGMAKDDMARTIQKRARIGSDLIGYIARRAMTA